MPPRRRVSRPPPPKTPRTSLAAFSDGSSSPDPLDVISQRGSSDSERHSVYIKPKPKDRKGSNRDQSSDSSIQPFDHREEKAGTEFKNTGDRNRNRNWNSEGSPVAKQQTEIQPRNHRLIERPTPEQGSEAEVEGEWASFRDNDKQTRKRLSRSSICSIPGPEHSDSSQSPSLQLELLATPADHPFEQKPNLSRSGLDIQMDTLEGGGSDVKVEEAQAKGEVVEERGSQETLQVNKPIDLAEEGTSARAVPAEDDVEVFGEQDKAEAKEEGTARGGLEIGDSAGMAVDSDIPVELNESRADDTNPSLPIDSLLENPDSPTPVDNDPQVGTAAIAETDAEPSHVSEANGRVDTEKTEPVAAGEDVTIPKEDHEMEVVEAPAEPSALSAPATTPQTVEGEVKDGQVDEQNHEMDSISTRPQPDDQPASTLAASAHEMEEGEEEIDPDTAPTPEADEADMSNVDVEMDGSSGIVEPEQDLEPKVEVKIRKKPGPKPKPKLAGAGQKVEAAAKKVAKGTKAKAKVDELKSSSKSKTARFTPESNYPSSASVASTSSKPAEATPDPTSDRTYCVCRKKESEDDEDVLMVGCESCDDWFHAACVGLTEDQVENLDVYICRSCERSTKQKTVYKKACKRDGCEKGLGTRESKFCSDLCAYKHFRSFTDSITNKKTLKALSTSFVNFPKPVSVQIIHHADIQATPVEDRSQQLLTAVQEQLSAASAALEIVRKRQQILQIAIDRAELLAPITVQPEEGRSGKGRRKGGGGPTEDKQCGWDPRLTWDDEAVHSWVQGQDEVEICGLAKRRCDKHQGWQKNSAFSLETEERSLSQQHDELENQKENLVKSAESTAESEKARSEFKARLVAKGKA